MPHHAPMRSLTLLALNTLLAVATATKSPQIGLPWPRQSTCSFLIPHHGTNRVFGAISRQDNNEQESQREDDDDDDDEAPTISMSPQEFLWKLQRQAESSAFPSSIPSLGPARGTKKSRASEKPVFACTQCGSEYAQWRGRCGTCLEWNTVQEFNIPRKTTLGEIGSSQPLVPKKRTSWLTGAHSESFDRRGGGPVRLTEVYQDVLGQDKDWKEAYHNGSRERRTIVPHDPEINAVLGGGIMPGSIILVGGDPGVGKSTLLLQVAGNLAAVAERSLQFQGIGMGPPVPSPLKSYNTDTITNAASQALGGPVLYVSGEENANQIASRALRLGIQDPELILWCETDADVIADMVVRAMHGSLPVGNDNNVPPLSRLPSLIIIDSIQTMLSDAAGSSSAGGIVQVRECVGLFLRLAKSTGVPIMLIGHVTKSGDVAGPRTVEHMVDCVLYLEGGGSMEGSGEATSLRVLRAAKNRFGSSEEVGVYEMDSGRDGRLVPVSDPSSFFLATRQDNFDSEGCAISVVLEGIRSMTVEVQALVAGTAGFGAHSGRRVVDGILTSRLLLILAVLQKRFGISFNRKDVYVNVVGGMHLGKGSKNGGGSDVAVAVACVSSLLGIPVRADTAFVGEVGLLGELRPVHSLEKRINEARRMGFSRIVTPSSGGKKAKTKVRGKAVGPREVSAVGIQQLMCDNVLDAINCGLVKSIPTFNTASGPKLKQVKRSKDSSPTSDSNSSWMDDLDIILDDEDNDTFE